MDRTRFDALARLISTRQSRRSALGALLGATLLGRDPDASVARNNRWGKVRAQAKTKACYPGTRCSPGRGRNTSGCDFSNTTVFVNKNVRGANLSNSNFTGADATGADFRGANLSGACFVDATLRNAKLGASVNLHQAIFCNTLMPDGSVNNSGCDKGTACCPTACQGPDCPPPGGCQLVGELCGAIAGPCCQGEGECSGGVFSTCHSACSSNQECQQRFPSYDVSCVDGTCVNQGCAHQDGDCPHSKNCCEVVCCIGAQTCRNGGCIK